MNRYFDKNESFNSNSRIFQAYYTPAKKREVPLLQALKKYFEVLCGLLQVLCQSRVLRIAKAVTFSCVLVLFIGVAGAIEHGSLGLGSGLLISFLLLVIEYLCLRPRRTSNR